MHRKHRKNIKSLTVGNSNKSFELGGGAPLMLIAGPCVVEDHGLCLEIATEAERVAKKYNLNYVFKASFDKANKTIAGSYRGPSVDAGLKALAEIKKDTESFIITDVHEPSQCNKTAEIADILQIPALLSKQIDLILAAGKTGKVINIKKGQFTAPWEMNNVCSRMEEESFSNCIVTERGYMFGYQTMITDMRSLQIMSELGRPVIFDGSHSVHGNDIIKSGTNLKHRDFIKPLSRSAAANGIDGIFLEIHPDPDKALSDSAGTLDLKNLDNLVEQIVAIDNVLSGGT